MTSFPEPVWEVKSLAFQVEGRPILEDVSFEVGEGEFLSIVGPNGAGKTTLLRFLDGIIANRGAIRFRGQALESWERRALARRLSYVPQMKGSVPPFDVETFLSMSRFPHISPWRGPGRHDRETVRAVMRRIGLEALAHHKMNTLSGGERQIVFMAAAMVQETPAVLLDEPTVYLDPSHAARVGALLRELNQTDRKTLVMVTHDINAALRLSTRILGLKAGRLRFFCAASEVGQRQLEELFDVGFVAFHEAIGGHDALPVFIPADTPFGGSGFAEGRGGGAINSPTPGGN